MRMRIQNHPRSIGTDTIILQVEEINRINNGLKSGDRKQIAAVLEISPVTLSRYFSYRDDIRGWKMSNRCYDAICKQIEANKADELKRVSVRYK